MKDFTREELLKLAEFFIRDLPLGPIFDDIPEGLREELSGYKDVFRGFVPLEHFPKAFLFFCGKLGWTPKRFREERKELANAMEACKKDARDLCLSPVWLKERTRKCYLCPVFEEDPEAKVNLLSDEFIEEWYDQLSKKRGNNGVRTKGV